MATDPYRYFRSEARELVERLGQGVLGLENHAAAPDVVAALFRFAHTLKGAARVVRLSEIADLAHSIEDQLAALRESGGKLPRAGIDAVLAALDEISSRIDRLDAPELAKPSDSRPQPPVELRTIRAEVSELDDLLDTLTEVSTRAGAIRRTAGVAERARHMAQLLAELAASPRLRESATAQARLAALADELRGSLATVERDLTRGLDDLARELREAKTSAEQLRLFPASVMFTALQRTARDAAEHQGVEIELHARGGDVRLDAHMLNALQPALVQLVRNAVVHGIERPEERIARGKPRRGSVAVVISTMGRQATFSCEDDGRGLDLAALRRRAEDRGVAARSAQSDSADAIFELLLKGGLTTSEQVTQVSGRGVGLDVVRAAAERLGGRVSVRNHGASGTTIDITVPMSLSSLDALRLETESAAAAIPLASVQRSLRISSGDITSARNGLTIAWNDRIVPFAPLSTLLGSSESVDRRGSWSAVIVRSGNSVAAIGATRLMAAETLVVRPLPPATPANPMILGAAVDADGMPQLVLDPDEVVQAILRAGSMPGEAPPERPAPMLIVDDSMTTRMLEQSILESAGYEVDLAASAEEALDLARQKRYSLFLVDVEMPGMDGFEFITRTRADPVLQNVPAILVTSREAESDRRRGAEAGASAYIVKTEFDQAELLRIIRGLVSAR